RWRGVCASAASTSARVAPEVERSQKSSVSSPMKGMGHLGRGAGARRGDGGLASRSAQPPPVDGARPGCEAWAIAMPGAAMPRRLQSAIPAALLACALAYAAPACAEAMYKWVDD